MDHFQTRCKGPGRRNEDRLGMRKTKQTRYLIVEIYTLAMYNEIK